MKWAVFVGAHCLALEQSHLKNDGPGSLHGVSVLLLLKVSTDLVGLFMQVPAGARLPGTSAPPKALAF